VSWPDAQLVAQARLRFDAALPDVTWFQQALARHGFQVPQHGLLDEETRAVIAAFQMKYRPARYDGQPDAETAAMLQALGAAPNQGSETRASGPAPAGQR
jgi:N-acetylmuramoyl-L-alanine amidase